MRVAATNYDQFAIVFFKKVSQNKEYFKTTLYGRSSTPSGTQLRVTLEGPTPTQPPRSPPAPAPLRALGRRGCFLQTLHEEGL